MGEHESEVHIIAKNCMARHIANGKVLVVELYGNDRETVEAWIDFSAEVRRTWNSEDPMYILVDMSSIDFSFGMFARRKATEMLKINAQHPTYISWVTKDTVIGNLMRTTLEYANVLSRTIKFALFYTHREALTWLIEQGAPVHNIENALAVVERPAKGTLGNTSQAR